MVPRNRASLALSALAAFALVACSDQSPVAPRASPDGVQDVSTLARAVAGSYELSFFATAPELILQAHVFTESGDAQGGRVTFQICLLRGGPTLQMVPLPSSECESGGSGTWVHLATVEMGTCPSLGSGYACIDFGVAPSTATVGFRFRYVGQGGGIANGVSAPLDFVP